MELQKIVVLCLGVIVVGGGALFLLGNSSPQEEPAPATTSTPSSAKESNPEDMEDIDEIAFEDMDTLRRLMMDGAQMRCDFTSRYEGGESSGTMYFDGGRYRIDAVATADGMESKTDIIYTPDKTYTWSKTSEGLFAFMMDSTPLDEADSPFVTGENPHTHSSSAEMKDVSEDVYMSYDCRRWNADGSLFVPPSDIDFVDTTAMMQGMEDMMKNINAEGSGEIDMEAMEQMMLEMNLEVQ